MKYMLIILVFFNSPSFSNTFDLSLKREKPHEKSLFWGPFVSFFVPGVDQFYEKKFLQGSIFSTYAFTGLSLVQATADDVESNHSRFNTSERSSVRKNQLGNQMFMTAGSLSAFQSYRSAVAAKKKFYGAFEFVPNEDAGDLMMAPFEFKYFTKKTTWIPLSILASLILIDPSNSNFSASHFSSTDAIYTSAYSFQAGVGEEAIFRGIMMTNLYEGYNSLFWSNMTTALVFGAAHGVETIPLPQIAMGYYLGWLTQQNKWSLKEAVFLHTWWDVLAIGASYAAGDGRNNLMYLPLYAKQF